MRRLHKIRAPMAIITPLVVAGIVISLWLVFSAARENLRFAHATDQILGAVSSARDVRMDASTSPERATADLFEQLARFEKMHVVSNDPAGRRFMINPWGGHVSVAVQPSTKLVGFETDISPSACRRLVDFFAKTSLEINRVETHDDSLPDAVWRPVYAVQPGGKVGRLNPAFITAGCGVGTSVVLRLVFSLP
jgi:hypothetical protein